MLVTLQVPVPVPKKEKGHLGRRWWKEQERFHFGKRVMETTKMIHSVELVVSE